MTMQDVSIPQKLRNAKRILIKLSGEALRGDTPFGFHGPTLKDIAHQLGFLRRQGLQIGIVVGGGNICRGSELVACGIERIVADQVGLLATVMNGLVLSQFLEQEGIPTQVMSQVPIIGQVSSYMALQARDLIKESIIICTGGTGNPLVTTDTAAVLRAQELKCDLLLKASTVDGVYSADPAQDPQAKFYPHLSHDQVMDERLKIMDLAAMTLAQESKLPILVCSLDTPSSLETLWHGQCRYTLIDTLNK